MRETCRVTWGCEKGRPCWRKEERGRPSCSGDRRRPISPGFHNRCLRPLEQESSLQSSSSSCYLFCFREGEEMNLEAKNDQGHVPEQIIQLAKKMKY